MDIKGTAVISKSGRIKRISGPVIVAEGLEGVQMNEVVRVGKAKLIGEVVELAGKDVSIQVYEETSGLRPGEEVESSGSPLSVELGPGLIGSIYDGIQRPLDIVMKKSGNFIKRGIAVYGLPKDKKWSFRPSVKKGDAVKPGNVIGSVKETAIIEHKIMVPPGVEGIVHEISSGEFTVEEEVAVITGADGSKTGIRMYTKWPVRLKRPYNRKFSPVEPLISGQRVIDTFFPIAKGGVACIPGPFGSGKTVVQQQLAKWTDADVVVYIGCGERGNEMTDVLQEFPELEDPYSGEPLIKRTVLIANTSNMPVAAREASIYTGTTIAEYFRDMGYKVALMADSTSRWAEALREMSGRLEEMPGEEGYPAYLASRVAEFYERGGRVECLGGGREGSLSIIGAVSPPGGDLSDPVVKNTLRVVKVFWGLDDDLSSQRHFPAIHWLRSYSLYLDNINDYCAANIGKDFTDIRNTAMSILQKEESLQEIVRLVGEESLSDRDRQVMDTAKMIREDFLQQHAFDPDETYTPIGQQYRMLKSIINFYDTAVSAIEEGSRFENITILSVREKIARMKYITKDRMGEFDDIDREIKQQIKGTKDGSDNR
ncbi:MAG: V-type ATP synthase subunit A [Elusimicrobia bacterium]|nr:V-type ATP synthase subunit A [Elusimicrobiota bacterium]